MKRLSGRVAIVTGGAQGIGEGIVRRLASEGAQVVVADHTSTAFHAQLPISGSSVTTKLGLRACSI